MSEGNRRKVFTPWRIAILATLGLVAILVVGFWKSPQEVEPSATPSQREEETNGGGQGDRSVTCHANCQVTFGPLAGNEEAGPGAGEGEPQPDSYSAEGIALSDFWQQRRMAHWTTVIAVLTGYGALLLILTLVEALRTSEHAEKMLEEQRRSDERTLRAYVGISECFIGIPSDERSKFVPINVVVENAGQTPAYQLSIYSAFVMAASIKALSFKVKGIVISPKITLNPKTSHTVFHGVDQEFMKGVCKATVEGTHRGYLFGVIRYRDFTKRRRWTLFCTQLETETLGDITSVTPNLAAAEKYNRAT